MLQSPLYYNTTRVIYSKSLCLGCKRLMVLTTLDNTSRSIRLTIPIVFIRCM